LFLLAFFWLALFVQTLALFVQNVEKASGRPFRARSLTADACHFPVDPCASVLSLFLEQRSEIGKQDLTTQHAGKAHRLFQL
jgi:hypothetical protein